MALADSCRRSDAGWSCVDPDRRTWPCSVCGPCREIAASNLAVAAQAVSVELGITHIRATEALEAVGSVGLLIGGPAPHPTLTCGFPGSGIPGEDVGCVGPAGHPGSIHCANPERWIPGG